MGLKYVIQQQILVNFNLEMTITKVSIIYFKIIFMLKNS